MRVGERAVATAISCQCVYGSRASVDIPIRARLVLVVSICQFYRG
jgi:hypothetical protein